MRERLRNIRESLWAEWERSRNKFPRLSRPWRVVRNMACIVIAVYLTWLFAGGPALTNTWLFRQAEQRAMVGPSEILGTISVDDNSYQQLMVGETKYGIVLLPLNEPHTVSSATRLYYAEKTGDITLLCVPYEEAFTTGNRMKVTVMVFTGLPAVRAEVDLKLSYEYFEKDYFLSGEVREEGFFTMKLEQLDSGEGREGSAIWRFLDSFYQGRWYDYGPMLADVRLYDGDGNLLREEHIDLYEEMQARARLIE